MSLKTTLHITNGSSLTERLKVLQLNGEFLTWHEMLCEGPTILNIDSDEFINTRETFLGQFYNLEYKRNEFKSELNKLNHLEQYDEIILWFEYDLFCHINLIAVVSLLLQKGVGIPIKLVCSGRINGEKGLKGLPELNSHQLKKHYKERITLKQSDLELAQKCWGIYNSENHNDFKPLIVTSSSFEYLTNCLKAHLKRFPDTRSGLGTLEFNILKLIKTNNIKSLHHLLGYALNYQGYYGFGDIQLKRLMERLSDFYTVYDDKVVVNREGDLVLLHLKNVHDEIENNMSYGGVLKYDYVFNKKENKLFKTV
ncbi:DUF1835 domain-containing protein [Aurantibacter sp.]|uniref:DUF1835 domain-containing protein n=1 Tax=Aurantibacter sp. TaxID=2807103 RepID=UPI0035C80FEC